MLFVPGSVLIADDIHKYCRMYILLYIYYCEIHFIPNYRKNNFYSVPLSQLSFPLKNKGNLLMVITYCFHY